MDAPFDNISVKSVSKCFGETQALIDVSLELRAGELSLIRGANGSGKSTLLSLLALLVSMDTGEIRFGEYSASINAQALHRHIGYLGHAPMLYPHLNAAENLSLMASLFDIPKPKHQIARLFSELSIGDFAKRPAHTWSKGQLQRVSLARMLIHQPKLLLFDEPTTGLDVNSQAVLQNILEQQKSQGAIIALVSHHGHLSAKLTDHVFTFEEGRLVHHDNVSKNKTEQTKLQTSKSTS